MMIYTFGRGGAVIKMRIEDYYSQGRRGWVRLHEKGGKRHEMPRVRDRPSHSQGGNH